MDAVLRVVIQDTEGHDLVLLLNSPVRVAVESSGARAEGVRQIQLLQDLVDEMWLALDETYPVVSE